MYEHPHLAYTVSEHDQEQIRQAADRRRFLMEHSDQIIAREPGPIGRLARRILRSVIGDHGLADDSGSRALAADPADTRGADARSAATRRRAAAHEPAHAR